MASKFLQSFDLVGFLFLVVTGLIFLTLFGNILGTFSNEVYADLMAILVGFAAITSCVCYRKTKTDPSQSWWPATLLSTGTFIACGLLLARHLM
jgi:uncharacterized membrane protein YuzA (DUF378 family)